jgi:hypothetical protein
VKTGERERIGCEWTRRCESKGWSESLVADMPGDISLRDADAKLHALFPHRWSRAGEQDESCNNLDHDALQWTSPYKPRRVTAAANSERVRPLSREHYCLGKIFAEPRSGS